MNKKFIINSLFDEFDSIEKEGKIINVDRKEIVEFYKNIRELLFLNYYKEKPSRYEASCLYEKAKNNLYSALHNSIEDIEIKIEEVFNNLLEIKDRLNKDIQAIFNNDPSCYSCLEVVLTLPGFFAITAYRIAHILYKVGLKFSARVISEYAHSRTGIDINAGAEIGEYFFIDHGTGVVIGETCVIGNNVKIYQGVTLGALSLKEGRNLVDVKRHPTIQDNVTIYSGTSIFGGETIIGKGSTIGSNCFILSSIPENSLVKNNPFSVEIINKRK